MAQLADVTRWTNVYELAGRKFKHKLVFVDRNNDGKYDYIKNYICEILDSGENEQVGQWGFAFKVFLPTNSTFSEEMISKDIANQAIKFSLAASLENLIDSNNIIDTDLQSKLDIMLTDSAIDDCWGVMTFRNDSCIFSKIAIKSNSELTEEIKKYIVNLLIPGTTEVFTDEDFYNNYNEINQIVNNNIEIKVGKLGAKATDKIEIYDLNGAKVKSIQANNMYNVSINVSDLQNGTYILKVVFLSGYSNDFNILINR